MEVIYIYKYPYEDCLNCELRTEAISLRVNTFRERCESKTSACPVQKRLKENPCIGLSSCGYCEESCPAQARYLKRD